MRAFVGSDLVPNATTLLKFRYLLERHELTRRLFRNFRMGANSKCWLCVSSKNDSQRNYSAG